VGAKKRDTESGLFQILRILHRMEETAKYQPAEAGPKVIRGWVKDLRAGLRKELNSE